jgi:hypothetical protein
MELAFIKNATNSIDANKLKARLLELLVANRKAKAGGVCPSLECNAECKLIREL